MGQKTAPVKFLFWLVSMANEHEGDKRRWGADQRLEFIEFRAFWEGGVNRSDITDRFAVSITQASNDLTQYRELAPENLTYDSSAKRYVASPEFKPRLLTPNPDRYLSQLRAKAEGIIDIEETWLGAAPDAQAMPVPSRRVSSDLFRELLALMRAGQSADVQYQSMSPKRPETLWRRITPHAFGSDGLRWHVRGFCHIDGRFKDFILSRWRGLKDIGPAGASAHEDADWHETFDVILEPNPALSPSQRAAVAWEYDMPKGRVSLSVRRALLYYLHKRLRLDIDHDLPAETPVVVANRIEFDQALASANGRVGGAVS
jgi:predicted DNA-binding transcriptional regulator YafY